MTFALCPVFIAWKRKVPTLLDWANAFAKPTKRIVTIASFFIGRGITMVFSCGARSAPKLKERSYLRSMLSRRQLQGFVMRGHETNRFNQQCAGALVTTS